MATGPKELKQLLDRLIEQKVVPFEDVLAIFAGKGGKLSQGAVMERLNFLWNECLFALLDADGKEVSWNDDAAFKAPAGHALRFLGSQGGSVSSPEKSLTVSTRKTSRRSCRATYGWA